MCIFGLIQKHFFLVKNLAGKLPGDPQTSPVKRYYANVSKNARTCKRIKREIIVYVCLETYV